MPDLHRWADPSPLAFYRRPWTRGFPAAQGVAMEVIYTTRLGLGARVTGEGARRAAQQPRTFTRFVREVPA